MDFKKDMNKIQKSPLPVLKPTYVKFPALCPEYFNFASLLLFMLINIVTIDNSAPY